MVVFDWIFLSKRTLWPTQLTKGLHTNQIDKKDPLSGGGRRGSRHVAPAATPGGGGPRRHRRRRPRGAQRNLHSASRRDGTGRARWARPPPGEAASPGAVAAWATGPDASGPRRWASPPLAEAATPVDSSWCALTVHGRRGPGTDSHARKLAGRESLWH